MRKTTLLLLFTVVLITILSLYPHGADNELITSCEEAVSEDIVLIFAGDVMGHMPQIKAAYLQDSDSFDFRPCYQYLRPYIEKADIAIANLEVPLAGKPYSGYPNFSSPNELLDGPVWAGFDVMLLANNHAADKGKLGIEKTVQQVGSKVKFAGVYLDSMQRDSLYPLMMEVKGVKLAFLNCTYDTNGNPVSTPQIVNRIDTAQIRNDIQRAKARKADLIIMTIHWGTEYMLKANQTQQSLAQYFVNLGVDLIIGSHPHVIQNFDLLYRPDGTMVPVYYSLGNAISNQSKRNTNGGILAEVSIDPQSHTIRSCSYHPFYVYKGEIASKYQYYLIPTTDYLGKKFDFQLNPVADSLLQLFNQDTHKRLSNLPLRNVSKRSN